MNQIVEITSAYRMLNPNEKTFVDGYVYDLEMEAARTGQKIDQLLKTSDRQSEYLTRHLVVSAIFDRVREVRESMELNVYRTLKELSIMAYSNLGNYMIIGEDGIPEFDFTKCTPEQMAAVKSFEVEEKMNGGRKVKVVLHDKVASLDKVLKYLGLLTDDHWRAENAKAAKAETMTADTSDEDAAELWARHLDAS